MSFVITIFMYVLAFLLLSTAIGMLYVAWRVLFASKMHYQSVSRVYGASDEKISIKINRAFRGEASVADRNEEFYLINAGLAFNKKTKMFEAQGRLSDEALDFVVEPHG
jgi:hypothetical protein